MRSTINSVIQSFNIPKPRSSLPGWRKKKKEENQSFFYNAFTGNEGAEPGHREREKKEKRKGKRGGWMLVAKSQWRDLYSEPRIISISATPPSQNLKNLPKEKISLQWRWKINVVELELKKKCVEKTCLCVHSFENTYILASGKDYDRYCRHCCCY